MIKSLIRSLQKPGCVLSTLPLSESGNHQVWGPVADYQYACDGCDPVQKYVTVLLRTDETRPRWLLVRQVNNLHNGMEWTRPPVISEITESAASHWLRENQLLRAT